MRRVWIGCLVLLLGVIAVTGTARSARADDLPYEGTWKILLIQTPMTPQGPVVQEVNFWLVKPNQKGTRVKVVAGVNPAFASQKASEVKADGSSLHFLLKGKDNEFGIAAYVPKGKDKPEALLGSLRFGSNFIPLRMEKTEATTIDQKTAVKQAGGVADLQAALKTTDAEDKIKDLEDIIKTYEGKPITMITSQILLGELIKKKAGVEAIKPVAVGYLKAMTPYGREMTLQANSNLAQVMLNHDKTVALALDYAQKASKLLKEDDNRGVKLAVYLRLCDALHKNKKDDDVKGVLAKITDIAEDVIKKPRIPVGPLLPTQQMAQMLLNCSAPAVADAGLEYARRAVKLLTEETPVREQLGTYRLLRAALASRKKEDEAKGVAATIDKLEEKLDKEYEKTALGFKPEKYAGRKGKSNRAVVVEVFTGSECPPCVAADTAFDALGKTYSPKDVVLLQYHLHIPLPDPMTNADTEARQKLYQDDIEGTPTMFVDGKVTAGMGGAKAHAKARYDALREVVDKALETEPEAKVKLDVKRQGDKIDISADVSDVKATAKAKLCFVLAEETVRYVGGNGLRLHHHVVRATPGGAAGFALEKKGGSHKASVDLTELRKKLNGYLDEYAKKRPFRNPERPLALKKLKVVALVQVDDDPRKILQAAQADVPEPKGGAVKPKGDEEQKEEKKEEKKEDKKEKD
jgi:hypothetical protein